MSQIYVIYHAHCPDGVMAALAAKLYLGAFAEYIPHSYGKPKPDIPDGSTVYFVDFSWPKADLEELAARSKRVIVLDHHKSAEEDLGGFPKLYAAMRMMADADAPNGSIFVHFDMGMSGAGLAWQYFHPSTPMPLMVQLIQDRDIWAWLLPESKPFSAYLDTKPATIEAYSEVYDEMTRKGPERILGIGRELLAMKDSFVERLIHEPFWIELDGHRVIAANAAILQSEVGHRLLELHPESPFAVALYRKGDGLKMSLRGRGDFDVSAVTKKFGGGGHKSAGGMDIKGIDLAHLISGSYDVIRAPEAAQEAL